MTTIRSIDELLEEARGHIRRVCPASAVAAIRHGALLIDLRPLEYRLRFGEVPGAIPVSRHVLEWRLDPQSPDRLPVITDHDQAIVLMCSEGYTSSLAARSLQELGLTGVVDLEGGFRAWQAAGLPWLSHGADPEPREREPV